MFGLLPRRHSAPLLIACLSQVAIAPALTWQFATTAQAQSITSADSVTTVQQTGSQFQIDGGALSGDSTVLFHSFDQFGLLTGESVQFGNPDSVKNIIGRVVGGEASLINGLLSVDGIADLYLLNPSGVFLGENTQLNLGGSFSVSTATGLVFGDQLFDTLGNNDVTLFNGAPTGYVFAAGQTSAIVNAGDLAVNTGESLTLLGGQVITTGSLSAPGGEIVAMAVPGESLVRLSPTGSLLDLELETVPNNLTAAAASFSVSTVPALLTGASDLGMATAITVSPDGTLSLTGSALQVPLDSNTVVVSGELGADGGNIGVLGDRVALINADVDASGDGGGGTVLIGGDQLGNGSVPNATVTVIDQNSIVRADARATGNGGKIVAWGTNLLSSAGQLLARGGLNGGDGGFIETSSLGQLNVVTAPNVSAMNGLGGLWLLDPPNIRIVDGDALVNIAEANPFDASNFTAEESLLGVNQILNALTNGGNVEVRTTGDTPGDGNITLETPLDYDDAPGTLSLVAEGDITILEDIFDSVPGGEGLVTEGGVVLLPADFLNLNLTANGQITIEGSISTNGGQVSLISNQAGVDAGDIDTGGEFILGNGITIQALDDIVTAALSSFGGDILLESQQGDILLTDPSTPTEILPSIESLGGDITLLASQGSVDVAETISTSPSSEVSETSGNVTIDAQEFISVDGIFTNASELDGGQVILRSPGNIAFDFINTISETAAGGNVIVESTTGTVQGREVVSFISPTGTVQGEAVISFASPTEIPEVELEGEPEERSATIVTNGFTADGTITITHGGGGTIPFDLGDASVNGTAGALTTGSTTLEDGNPNEPFLGSFETGNIQIITTDVPPPEVPPTPEEPPELDPCITDCQADTDLPQDPQLPPGSMDPLPTPEVLIQRFEEKLTTEVANYLKSGLAEGERLPTYNGQANQAITSESLTVADLPTAQDTLLRVQGQTGQRPALIYAVFGVDDTDATADVLQAPSPSDPLELLLITAEGRPKYVRLSATRGDVLKLAQRFRRQVATPSRVVGNTYLRSAQQLYDVLIEPLEAELKAQNIDTISFITDAGLRSVPLAALHDGEGFIIENYNVGLMPSLSLTDLTYQDLSNVSALVAGTSAFANQASLPGVPVELKAISSDWKSTVLQDDAFSLNKLTMERQQSPYGIIHLATHGEFNVGDLSKSYLYLHNERLRLNQLRTLGLNRPAVELLTLSACQTALGNRSAELGFAGFAVLAGAKTSVASLWNVSDEASAGLMIEFYRQLQENQPIIKAEALRAAQLAMLRGEVFVDGDQLHGVVASRPLPAELTTKGQVDFRHPYYWAAFSLVGSPW